MNMSIFFQPVTARLEAAITVHHPRADTVCAFSLLERQLADLDWKEEKKKKGESLVK